MGVLQMDLNVVSVSKNLVNCCNCGCSCSAETWIRTVKRKYDEFEEGDRFFLPGVDCNSIARVQIENECDVLREMVNSQLQTIQDLCAELEEERNASASAANETMSMMLRLQREKAEVQMEARQFKRFAEEKMAHDHQEILALEDLLYKREQIIESLTFEVQAYKHRMMSYGLTEADIENLGASPDSSVKYLDSQFESATYGYPSLRCDANETHGHLEEGDDDLADMEQYAFGETSRNRDSLRNLESRISQLERSPSYSQLDGDASSAQNVVEKGVVGHSPRTISHSRKFSSDSSSSVVIKELSPDLTESPSHDKSFRKTEESLRRVEVASEAGDDMSDRVYTIDSGHNGAPLDSVAECKTGVGASDEFVSPPKESLNYASTSDPDVQKLYTRLQALEADRESMRQALLSMRTDKVQLMLLKEIAQHLCSPERRMSSNKTPALQSFSFTSVCKWVVSFVFWRRRSNGNKHALGSFARDEGLPLLLDNFPRMRQWRCLTSTQLKQFNKENLTDYAYI